MGHGFVATRNIEAGEVVLRNKPSSAVLDDDVLLTHCSGCMQRCEESVTCPGCTVVVFCSTCQATAVMSDHEHGECESLRK